MGVLFPCWSDQVSDLLDTLRATAEATSSTWRAMHSRILTPEDIPTDIRRLFRTKYVKRRSSSCWEWKAPDARGYGKFHFHGMSHQAHRVAWVIHRGMIPEAMVLDHLCRNRACVNPDHLEVVTQKVNVERSPDMVGGKIRATGKCQRGHDLTRPEAWATHTITGRHYCLECRRERNRESARRHAERKRAGVA